MFYLYFWQPTGIDMGMMSSGSNMNQPITDLMRFQCWNLTLLVVLATMAFASI